MMSKAIPFDSLNLYAVLSECCGLIGGRLQEIRQPEPLTIVLHLYAQRQEHRLLISADPQFARMHLLSRKLPNAPTPPPFCQSLRKYIEGALLRRIAQVGFDRIVQLEFETPDGIYALIAELMGKHSNIFLVNPAGLIQSALKWVSPRQSQQRPIRAGERYRLPPTRVEGLYNPLLLGESEWRALWAQRQANPERDWSDYLEGLSRFTATELELIAQQEGIEGLLEWAQRLHTARWEPVLVREPSGGGIVTPSSQVGHALGAYPMPCRQLPREWQHPRNSLNLAWEQAFTERIERAEADSLRNTLRPALQRALQARERALADIQRALQESSQADRYQLFGELILAFGHGLPPGSTHLLAPDYTQPDMPTLEIPLDPTRSLAENAQRYFEKARRARDGLSGLQARQARFEAER
ncbi:MAG: NFACT family protein, partial [Fimbriimonadales bacterium]|nr:NFACT family protein [Fimbriimonadales bacterium]